ncbi:MAG TPA: hypothetical protein VLC79_08810 [Cellvibrio sp.]|nr:hypothetical protein [Cellvibrio sp.]
METALYSNELFLITRVEVFDESEDKLAIFFELIERPNRKLGLFDNYSDAERAMKGKMWSLDEL